ncbi:tyrosine-type recombinase/integrase [Aeoliella straminimaris]|uniref:tyrosine-type recombinase/integrase n=1 Tax=Aeoliella straminimaris TaxID=2954799 RepID=UPI003CC645C4
MTYDKQPLRGNTMASIAKDPGGKRRILFVDPLDKSKRRTVRLGKMAQRTAEGVKIKVEHLIAAKASGHSIDADTASWVANIPDDLAEKLARVELIEPRKPRNVHTLETFLDDYIASRSDVKGSTATIYRHVRRCLLEFFGNDAKLASITPGDADKFRLWLADKKGGQGLGVNTVRRRCGIAKQFFRAALRSKLIAENPFADLKGLTIKANRERFHFVSRDVAAKVLDACPDAQWRLIFALSRYGGLRCPSEHLALTWDDVDWEKGLLRVSSPKTAHHEGKSSRIIPLFPELRKELDAVWAAYDEDSTTDRVHVITRYRDTNTNLRTQFLRIIGRAGVDPWPKLFHNLRSTRETELAEQFPIHVVCEWMGNTQAIAAQHYLQVTDEHYQAAQNAAQQAHAEGGTGTHDKKTTEQKPVVLSNLSGNTDAVNGRLVVREGLEPPTKGL